jgi:ectoine hydroxylase-related dioxygenase (phytanoyl-CoA dioxygenase family)
MRKDILRSNFNEFGYVVVEHILDQPSVRDFLEHELRVRQREHGAPSSLQRFWEEPHWHRLVTNPGIVSVLSAILRAEPRVVEAIYLPKFAGRPPEGIGFHRDVDHIRVCPDTLIGCWIALSDTDGDNGGLCVVPGSHKCAPPESVDVSFGAKIFVLENQMRDPDGRVWIDRVQSGVFNRLSPAAVVPLRVPCGSAVFFHGSLVHGSLANTTPDRDRLAVASHFVAEGTWVYRIDIQRTMNVTEPVSHSQSHAECLEGQLKGRTARLQRHV